MMANQQRSIKQVSPNIINSLHVAALPFYLTKFIKEPIPDNPIRIQFPESLKTRFGNAANSIKVNDVGENKKPFIELGKPENKTRRLYVSPEERRDSLTKLLHKNKDFEEAIIAAVLGTCKAVKTVDTNKHFRDISEEN